MPKRHHEETKEDRWKRKMKRYEHKLEGRRSARRIIYSEDEDDVQNQERLKNDLGRPISCSLLVEPEEALVSKNDDAVVLSVDAGPCQMSIDDLPAEDVPEDVIYDPRLLQALGYSEEDSVEYGEDLQADLATRFQKILLCGLEKETKDEILKKYVYPKNVTFAKGPALNPEIGAMLADTCKLRDKRLLAKQDQLGKALSALGKAMTSLMKKNSDVPDIIRTLNDAGRLLADSHFAETDTRRSVIIPLIDKSLIDPFKDRKRDNLLFGENLGDLVKNSRGIKMTSQLIQASVSSNINLNGRGSSSRGARNQRGGQNYTYNRAGGPRPMTSYQYTTSRRGRVVPQPPPAPARRHPAPTPPARRQQASYSHRYPATHRRT